MNRFGRLSIYSVLIFIIIFYLSKSLLHAWLYFNVFISIYEIYIISIRYNLNKDCKSDFWKEEDDGQLFKKAWEEYACVVDERYFSPNNYVFKFELINVILTILMFTTNPKMIKVLLFLQFLNCVCYFSTLSSKSNTMKSHLYRGISALWLVIPVILLYRM